jgi:hypothetical protein
MEDNQAQKVEIYGKKIFFVCATFTLNTNIILRLMEQEYEIYKIDQYRQLKSLLILNPQSIVYINLDSQNTPNVWYNFIQYFETEPRFKEVKFGAFSTKLKPAEKDRFTKSLKMEAGFYSVEKGFGEAMGDLMVRLEDLKAKGMRKFVRMSCQGVRSTEAFFLRGNMMYKMEVVDISSIGMGLKIPLKYCQLFRINTVIPGLNLVLGSKQLKVNAKIFGIKNIGDAALLIMIFTPDTEDSFRSYVRTFICEEMQKKLINQALSLNWDKTDYTTQVEVEEEKSSDDTSHPTSDESQATAEAAKSLDNASDGDEPQNAQNEGSECAEGSQDASEATQNDSQTTAADEAAPAEEAPANA